MVNGPQRTDPDRKIFWDKLNNLVTEPTSLALAPVCLLGDFNAIAKEDETVGLSSAKSLLVPQLSKWEEQERLFDL